MFIATIDWWNKDAYNIIFFACEVVCLLGFV